MFSNIACRNKLITPFLDYAHLITSTVSHSRTTPIHQNGISFQNPSLLMVTTRFIVSYNNVSESNHQKLTLDYLTNSCGLSPQSALKASKHILLKSTTVPDSVLALFNTYGFTQPQISRIIAGRPGLLLYSPDKILKPKLEFFVSMGILGPNLGHLVSTKGNFLAVSLENRIIPSVNYLRSLVATDEEVTAILNRSWWVLNDAQRFMTPNIAILRDHGVPQPNISKFLMLSPRTLYRKSDLFRKNVLQLVGMGFCPSSMMFLHGLHVLLGLTKAKWDRKKAVYKSFGWSEDDVLSVFKRQPYTMAASVKKISLALDFFMNTLNWTQEHIVMNSTVLLLSLEKRVIPRCHVLQILHSKNLISKSGMAQALRVAENVFLKKYVTKFHDVVPDLLNMYQGKMST